MKDSNPAAAIPGRAKGIEIFKNVCNQEWPASLYALSISGLISSKYPRTIQSISGNEIN